MTNRQYDQAVDIWGVGVTLAEILGCTDKYHGEGFSSTNRYIFKGDSCFPISPIRKDSSEVSPSDQLIKILEYINDHKTPEITYSFMTNATELHYLKKAISKTSPKGTLRDFLPKTSDDLIDILS